MFQNQTLAKIILSLLIITGGVIAFFAGSPPNQAVTGPAMPCEGMIILGIVVFGILLFAQSAGEIIKEKLSTKTLKLIIYPPVIGLLVIGGSIMAFKYPPIGPRGLDILGVATIIAIFIGLILILEMVYIFLKK